MLEMLLDRHVAYVVMGAAGAAGIVSKCVANVSLKRLVRGAGNMNKSNHPLMRLVRAKFEHACMVSEKVENVGVFVDKYLYEYRVLGMRLHGWRRLEKLSAGLCLLVGLGGALAQYSLHGMGDPVLQTGVAGAALGILVYVFHLTTDENYRLEAAKNYMVDYLENVCLHRYEKTYQKELKVMATDSGSMESGRTREESERQNVRAEYGMTDKSDHGEEPPAMPKPYPVPDVDEPIRGTSAAEAIRNMSGEGGAEAVRSMSKEVGAEAIRSMSGEGGAEAVRSMSREVGAEEVRSMNRADATTEPDVKRKVPAMQDNEEAGKDPEVLRALRIARETAAAVSGTAEAEEPEKKRLQRKESKDVLIRQILEEFMA